MLTVALQPMETLRLRCRCCLGLCCFFPPETPLILQMQHGFKASRLSKISFSSKFLSPYLLLHYFNETAHSNCTVSLPVVNPVDRVLVFVPVMQASWLCSQVLLVPFSLVLPGVPLSEFSHGFPHSALRGLLKIWSLACVDDM